MSSGTGTRATLIATLAALLALLGVAPPASAAPTPAITSISPGSSVSTGGQVVTVAFANVFFSGVGPVGVGPAGVVDRILSISFDGIAGTDPTLLSPTSATVVAPAHLPESVPVSVAWTRASIAQTPMTGLFSYVAGPCGNTIGFSGAGTGTPGDPYQVATAQQLCEVRVNPAAHYVLTADIDLDTSAYAGNWDPIGSEQAQFTGQFDGAGHRVSNLRINTAVQPVGAGLVGSGGPPPIFMGLFGVVSGTDSQRAVVKDLELAGVDVSVTGRPEELYLGSLVGLARATTLSGISVTGKIAINLTAGLTRAAGGVVGYLGYQDSGYLGSIADHVVADVDVTVAGVTGAVGGLFGGLVNTSGAPSIVIDSGAIGDISVTAPVGQSKDLTVGGLGGMAGFSEVIRSFATGNVTVTDAPVGINGANGDSIVAAGSLLGVVLFGTASDSYARGSVTGPAGVKVAAVVGLAFMQGDLTNVYGTGALAGTATRAAIWNVAASTPATTVSTYWDAQTSGVEAGTCADPTTCGTGKSTAAMKTQATFTGWNFAAGGADGSKPVGDAVWGICPVSARQATFNDGYPFLWSQVSSNPCLGTPGAPGGVAVTPQVGALGVAWAAPVDDGGAPVTGYTAVARLGGQESGKCTTTGALTCVISALTPGATYSVTVTATNWLGDSPASDPVSGVPLSPAQPNPDLGPNPAGAGRAMGSVLVLVNGVAVPASLVSDPVAGTVTLSGPGWSLVLRGANPGGVPLILSNGVLQLQDGGTVLVSATGLAGNSQLKVWLFSEALGLGTVPIGADGSGAGLVAVPVMGVGDHTLQVNGRTADGTVRSISLGVQVSGGARATAASTASKLNVQVFGKCAAQYKFVVHRARTRTVQQGSDEPTTKTTWKQVGGSHKTKGQAQSATINLPKGTYRAVVSARCGNSRITTNSVTLRK